jgi:hypothetical protein
LHVCPDAANLLLTKAFGEERRMDFNTGSSGGRSDDESRPLYGGETGGPARGTPRGPAGSPGGEFSLQDPVGSFVRTVTALVTQPVAFFRGIGRQGDFVNPLIFALICALISALLGGILSLVLSPLFAGPEDTAGETFAGGIAGFVVNLLLTPIAVAVGVLIGAGISHLLVLLLVKPQNTGFEATFRVVSYANVIQLVSWIPILGGLVALVWGVILSILGIREVHNTTTGKAALVVLIPAIVLGLLVLLLLGALVALFFGAQQQQF